MENLEWKSLKLWTSYVSPGTLRAYTEAGILPIFIARSIGNSNLIGKWHGTSVHIPELAPDPILLRRWKYEGMTDEVFREEFVKELHSVSLGKILGRIWTMVGLCGATGAVMMGYGENREKDHRSIVADYINSIGILTEPIKELVL